MHPRAAALFVAFLAACGEGSDPIPTGSVGAGGEGGSGITDATASTGGADLATSTTGTTTADGGAGTGGSAASGTGGSAGPGSTSSGQIEDLDALLARLRADLDGTLIEESLAGGWPVRVEEGRVIVSTDGDFGEVAGDFDDWAGTALTEDQGFAWTVVPDEAGAHYKLKSRDAFVSDPWSRGYAYDVFGEISFVTPPSAAHLERWPVVEGDLDARTVRAWVPAEAATRVLYVHDGQNLFDPEANFGGWHLDEAAPPAMLIVGIDNTAARFDEYTHVEDVVQGQTVGGLGDAYAAFIGDVVRPLVEERYGEPAIIGTMGSSLGGLISLHVALLDPDTYSFAASLSGTLGWGSMDPAFDNETIIQRYEAAGHQPFAIYLDSGGGGDTCDDADGDGTDDDDDTGRDNYCETLQMRDALEGLGWAFDVDLMHWWEEGAQHDEAAWAARAAMPLAMFADIE